MAIYVSVHVLDSYCPKHAHSYRLVTVQNLLSMC
jgi:hypothetical protein